MIKKKEETEREGRNNNMWRMFGIGGDNGDGPGGFIRQMIRKNILEKFGNFEDVPGSNKNSGDEKQGD